MPSINAHFDGHAFVPDEPLSLAIPVGEAVHLTWQSATKSVPNSSPPEKPGKFDDLLKHVRDFPDLPTDLSANHDHYVCGDSP